MTFALVAANGLPAAAQQDTIRVLYVPLYNLPEVTNEGVLTSLSKRGTMLSTARYNQAARSRSLRPGSIRTLRRLGPAQDPDIIVTARLTGRGERTLLEVTYRDGKTVNKLSTHRYKMRGSAEISTRVRADIIRHLERDQQRRLARANAAATTVRLDEITIEGGSTEDPAEGVAGEETGEDDGDLDDLDSLVGDDEPRAYLSARAGVGAGHRAITQPTESGPIRLSTLPFAAAHAEVDTGVHTGPTRRRRLGLTLRYDTSLLLSVGEEAEDGTTRTVDARSHEVSGWMYWDYKFREHDRSAWLRISPGIISRFFEPEQEIAVPKSFWVAASARIGFFSYVGSGPLIVGIMPELAFIPLIANDLRNAGVAAIGWGVGGQLTARYEIKEHFHLGFLYKELHAAAESAFDARYRDVSRSVLVRFTFAL